VSIFCIDTDDRVVLLFLEMMRVETPGEAPTWDCAYRCSCHARARTSTLLHARAHSYSIFSILVFLLEDTFDVVAVVDSLFGIYMTRATWYCDLAALFFSCMELCGKKGMKVVEIFLLSRFCAICEWGECRGVLR